MFLHAVIPDFWSDVILRFNVDHEASIPTWFAQTILLILSVLGFGLSGTDKKRKGSWMLFGALFLYLSIDEGSEIHELAIEPFQHAFDISSGPLFFAWVIPAIGLLALLAIIFWKFFWSLPKKTRLLLILSAVLFLSGAIIMEMISGNYWQAHDFQYDFTYRIMNAIEEGFEFSGVILAIYALMSYKESLTSSK